nr:hypothetical protein B0A51_06006 [Rachicladosporium sp. CCFEE 5018]
MLSRPPTKITLTQADITLAEDRKDARERAAAAQQAATYGTGEPSSSQDTTEDISDAGHDDSPAVSAQTAAARARKAREARIMGGQGARAIQQTFEFGSVNDLSHALPIPSQPDGDLISGPQLEDLYGSDDMESPVHTFNHEKRADNYGSGTPYWVSQIKRQGKAVYGVNASYVVWRNVKDYGAKGDGVTDDTWALGNATSDGGRCGLGCDSSMTTPAIVYFPAGTYMVSQKINLYYYTAMVGDANNLPIIKGTPEFDAIGLFDANPYLPYGFNWFQNQNNMWRQIRNFVFDLTLVDPNRGVHGIHWQVAQATSLQNIVFNCVVGTPGDGNAQQGVFMDNGSGGHLEDLIFNGGGIGLFAGNQQFTMRNLTFNRCNTAIFQNWNWVFMYKSIFVNNCGTAVDMSSGGDVPATGSLVFQDSVFTNTDTGIITSFSGNSTPTAAGTLVLDNVNFINTDPAVQYKNGTVIIPGNQLVRSYVQGKAYTAYESMYTENNLTCYGPAANSARIQQLVGQPTKPTSLLLTDGPRAGMVLERSKPQYEGVPVTKFKSSYDFGCYGDGVRDDTANVQSFLNSVNYANGEIAYFDHGAYVIRHTITIPNTAKMVGELWPLMMVDGSAGSDFGDMNNPRVAFRVGQPGDKGTVEITDMVFQTLGPAPGAIMMEWNLAGTFPGATGMWDTHWRIGGGNGTQLQSNNCAKQPNFAHGASKTCYAAFLLLHLTKTASLVMSNNWGWVADHEMDLADHNQIEVYNGRGLLVESQGPVWIYGSSFEHSQLYNYNIANAKEIYMGVIQSETAYMQNNPNSLSNYPPLAGWSDPDFTQCYLPTCPKTFGLRIFNSTYIYNYGAGLYSFFNNYDGGCLLTTNCQQYTVSVEQSEAIYLYALNTVGTAIMVEVDQVALVPEAANGNTFADTVAIFEYP